MSRRAPHHWILPFCDSRTGSSHLRRGAPCQDASALQGLLDGDGAPLQVLVVSDGHGGARYSRSEVGSRTACRVALTEVQRALAQRRIGSAAPAEWRHWLAEDLPECIVAAWLQELQQHWRRHPPGDGSPFSPLPYGATLAVLLLTPTWWGYTGLGDWDLVRIEAGGAGSLVSEEPEQPGGGEATCSLCLADASRRFAGRSGLHALTPGDPPFSLLLSTDGIRKSCGSDHDFLTLARYLVELPVESGRTAPQELASALDRISGQGSGDDVSVAVARWAPAARGPAWPQRGRLPPARIQQPPGPAAAMPLPGSSSPPPTPSAGQPGAAQGSPIAAGPSPAGSAARLRGLALLGGLAAGGLLLAALRGWGPFAAAAPRLASLSQGQRQALQRQVQQFCAPPAAAVASSQVPMGAAAARAPGQLAPRPPQQAASQGPPAPPAPAAGPPPLAPRQAAPPAPHRPAASEAGGLLGGGAPSDAAASGLNAYKSVFQDLRRGGSALAWQRLRRSQSDPISGLIALSFFDPSVRPGAPSPSPPFWGVTWPGRRPTPEAAGPLDELALCPALRQELARQWARPTSGRPGGGEHNPPAAAAPGPATNAAAGSPGGQDAAAPPSLESPKP